MTEKAPPGIAIVGMSCVFPGAPDLSTYWKNIQSGYDAITDVPPQRWDEIYYDPESNEPDRFYCRRGGFVDDYAEFDSVKFGIMPVAAEGSEPDQLMALKVAANALEDAGYRSERRPPERTAVVLGRGNYIGAGMTRLEQHVRTAEQLVQSLRQLVPDIDTSMLQQVKEQFQSKLGAYGPDTAIGLVPNLTASRISNRLDLKGPAYTVDGACASSLIAVDHAARELRSGRCDLALAGGIHLSHDVAFWSVFCQLGALSRQQKIRPFHADADGLLIGEGVGIIALKRLEDAQSDGDRIYAIIRGVGVSSDGREASIMTPRVAGQIQALQEAWSQAELDPSTVGLVEAHGTATPAGDAAELATLKAVFGSADGERRAVLGSVKSMIGHTMPAAGIAGLIKAALAVHHGVLPPSLYCDTPHPDLQETRFRVLSSSEPWPDEHRRAAVNAFGFGDINAHVVMESSGSPMPVDSPVDAFAARMSVWSATDSEALLSAMKSAPNGIEHGICRLVIHDVDDGKRTRAESIIRKNRRNMGRNDIWYDPESLLTQGKLVFLYPGVEARFTPQVADLIQILHKAPLPQVEEGDVEAHGYALVHLGRALTEAMQLWSVEPDMIGGHSVGEWTAMIASGAIPKSDIDAFMGSLVPGSLDVPGVLFLAAGCGEERARKAMAGLPDIHLSHDNCPRQVILCGTEASIRTCHKRLTDDRILCQELPFRSGFHSPLFGEYIKPHQDHFASLPIQAPRRQLWSANTCVPFNEDPEDIRRTAIDHLIQPVRFRTLLDNMYAAGGRVFIQMGTGSLSGFVGDTLRGHSHIALTALDDRRPAIEQMSRVVSALCACGYPIDPSQGWTPSESPSTQPGMSLRLGVPLVSFDAEISLPTTQSPLPASLDASDPVLREFQGFLKEVMDAGTAVVKAYTEEPKRVKHETNAEPRDVNSVAQDRVFTRLLSIDDCPDLLDHCFFRQPEGWSNMLDRFPVVPLTMLIEIMMDVGHTMYPDLKVTGLEHLRAYKWLMVEPAVEITVRARPIDDQRVRVAIEGYAECVLNLEAAYPPPPPVKVLSGEADPTKSMDGRALYEDRWMFHGPAYQGVEQILKVTPDGLSGVLRNLSSEGGLLDNAGQLLGYWVMVSADEDQLAMPVLVEKMTWHGPKRPPDVHLTCTVHIQRMTDRQVRADIDLVHEGQVWVSIHGWTDHRFDTTERSWPVIRYPERRLMAEPRPEGFVLLDAPFKTPASQDYFHRRYLSEPERAAYSALETKRAAQWLAGRIAAKDALRQWIWQTNDAPIFPVEIGIETNEVGAPLVKGSIAEHLSVSIAHTEGIAVAAVTENGQVGIDIERIEERSERFLQDALTASERALLPETDRWAWATAFWCAKEAVGKAKGIGLSGHPKTLKVAAIDGRRLRIEDFWVETIPMGNYMIGVTRREEETS